MKDCIDRDEVITLISRALHDILLLPKEQPEPYRRDQRDGDLISRQAAIDLLDRYFVNPPEYMEDYSDKLLHAIKDDLIDDVNSLPSAQPERKKGEWIKEDSIYETVTCSVCHGVRRDNRINHINFCNCCGADMRGESE